MRCAAAWRTWPNVEFCRFPRDVDPSSQLYESVRSDRALALSLYRQALTDPAGTVSRIVDLAAERGLHVTAAEVRAFVSSLEDPDSRRWLDKARGGL